ncbi:YwqG family protein [Pedobacter sp. GSP4]|uniref:YwqG family protein n=1 Tax=Pedobacter sp. GSP4 TaxID=3453716 RepID=UPI003EEBC798
MKSFFSRLFGGGSSEPDVDPVVSYTMLEPIQVAPDLILPIAFAEHFDKVRSSALLTVKIKAIPAEDIHFRNSSFGSYPCLPKGFDYPRDKNGNFMYPLAQINFSEFPPLENFPKSGYLQFYIAADDMYGISFEEKVPSDIKVLFFEESDLASANEDLSFLDEVLGSGLSPVDEPHALSFELKTEYDGLGDVNGLSEEDFNLNGILAANPKIKKQIEDAVYENFSPTGHKLGGYAYFTQWDPRDAKVPQSNYILLFQMDSDDHIIWGDLGVANFFIDPVDLANKDFSRVFYHWDCH